MKIAVLAVQGAFIEHEKALQRLGAETVELRKAEDLEKDFDGLVLPGGESTVQSRLLKELSMFEPLKEKIEEGLPVLATCAGLILLAQNVSNDEKRGFATLPVTVKRNAYGRKLGKMCIRDSHHIMAVKSYRDSGKQLYIKNVKAIFIFPYSCYSRHNIYYVYKR